MTAKPKKTRGVDVVDLPVDTSDVPVYNLVLTFGCRPSDSVPARSTIATNFFAELRNKAHGYDGSVLLPEDMIRWHNDDMQAGLVPLHAQSLYLKHSNWSRV